MSEIELLQEIVLKLEMLRWTMVGGFCAIALLMGWFGAQR